MVKNKDEVPPEVLKLMGASELPLIQTLFTLDNASRLSSSSSSRQPQPPPSPSSPSSGGG